VPAIVLDVSSSLDLEDSVLDLLAGDRPGHWLFVLGKCGDAAEDQTAEECMKDCDSFHVRMLWIDYKFSQM